MANTPNTTLRLLVPVVLGIAGLGIAVAVFRGSNKAAPTPTPQSLPASTPAPQPNTPATPNSATPNSGTPSSATPAAAPTSSPVPAAQSTLRPRLFPEPLNPLPLGELSDDSPFEGQLTFSPFGAGIASLKLSRSYETVERINHVELQAERTVVINTADGGTRPVVAVPFALLAVVVEGRSIDLTNPSHWRHQADASGAPIPGAFEAFIDDDAGAPVLRLARRFVYEPGSFDLRIEQQLQNLTDRPIAAALKQTGPVNLPEPDSKYGGDKRRVRFGSLRSEKAQAGSTFVEPDSQLMGWPTLLGEKEADPAGIKRFKPELPLWPTPKAADEGRRLAWFAFTDRYFAVAAHGVFDPAAPGPGGVNKVFDEVERVDRFLLNPYAEPGQVVVLSRITGPVRTLAPRATHNADLALYAGPLLERVINASPLAQSLNLQGLVAYNFGGFCAELCTFAWLTHVLLGVLRFYHTFTFDWAVAIILLVFTVRGVLHPITRWSQVRLLRFGVEMKEIGPKQAKLKERFKDDPQRLQQETARLFQEEGVNPAGALGCLPMFLQTPVWIALYATLFFAADMRHQPAFWGVFQSITGNNWLFLADLASPDRALPLGPLAFTPPFIGNIFGRVTAINLLPVVLGVVYFIQQKYLTPPTANLTPEQEEQQRIMKIMTTVLFPLLMYTAPSGLAIYFVTNSTLSILESRWVRADATKKGLLDPEKIKAEKAAKRAAPRGGFLARLQAMAEDQQRLRAQGGPAAPAPGKRRVPNTAPNREPPEDRYKKRR